MNHSRDMQDKLTVIVERTPVENEFRRQSTPPADSGPFTLHTDIVERLRLVEKVFDTNPDAIIFCDRHNRIVSVNPAFCEITGYDREEVIGRDACMLASGYHDGNFYIRMRQTLNDRGRWSGDIWGRRKNGAIYPAWMTINAVYEQRGESLTHYIAIFSDITARKEAEARIHRLAHHDPLTGLPNRFTLEARLAQSLADAKRRNNKVAIMFVDLDHFKTINDSLGHAIGDRLLVEMARRLTAAVRESDTVARLGGDEFIIVLPDCTTAGGAATFADKIIRYVAEPLLLDQHEFHMTVSIGISVFPDDAENVDAVMRNADTAMYHAKALGRNNFQYFASEMNVAATERLDLERKLRQALVRQEFELHYQPQYALAGRQIIGVEALLRWRHAGEGLIPPDRFIPVAEETGLITCIGEWVLREACRQLREWIDAGVPPLRMAINMSARQLRKKCFPETVAAVLREFDLAPSLLELEITESVAMEHPQEAITLLRTLKDMGVTLAIDDFGTGYSSLSYLKLLPIDRLKIDRSFITDIDHDANDAAIARATIALARSLGLQVIAEGVETAAQLAILKLEGCDEAQGFHFSRPLPANVMRVFLMPPSESINVVNR